ncbi:3'-5' exoribonuclease 1 [Perkinsus olseni]|uniref:3'-5' exoribonuclease 1 n=1 Tax=Perkinsus olseni TaxID=32597 RepID=A0A7J6M754_PEROL|nr:3'-5' exoribonuclease 1 [Perkinsus olseni]KAF4667403.1 3'-5' exoribonuclease 1 [Perkinsus olseni]
MVLYYAALDFECTCCDQTPQSEWLNEIIEFPVVFVNSRTLQVDFSFHSYVKPIEQRALTDFCTQLTGIVQNQVTDAPELPDVLDMFQAFLDDHGLTPIGTDGPWDIFKFLVPECLRKRIPIPQWALHYADVRRHFQYALRLEKWCSISSMLEMLGLTFEGRQHSGIDDATNIATIIITLANDRSQTMFTNRHVDVHSTPDLVNAALILDANPSFYSNVNWSMMVDDDTRGRRRRQESKVDDNSNRSQDYRLCCTVDAKSS